MNITRILAVCLALTSSLSPLVGACLAQTPTISCDAESVSVCERINNLSVSFVLGNVDMATVKTYSRLVVTYNDGRATSDFSSDCQNDITSDFKTHTLSLGTLSADMDLGVKSRTLKIISAYFENSDNDRLDIEVAEPSSITWTVYGNPLADDALPESDHRRLSILNDSRTCGFDARLETGNAWADVSTFDWSISNNADFTIVADGPNALLERKRVAGGVYASTTKTTKVTVRQTVGGVCSAEYTKEISLLGSPEATLEVDASMFPDDVVLICSSAAEGEDAAQDLSGWITVNGTAPLAVTLTTGDKFVFEQSGRQSFKNAHVTSAGRVTVRQVVDANGCVADESTPDFIHGGMTVYDRKPKLSFDQDSVYCPETTVLIKGRPADEMHDFVWGMASDSRGLNAGIAGDTYTYEARAWSNMMGKVRYYVVETAPALGFMAECSSDTAFFDVYFDMPLRYPNAISPNGDGKNDRLVIERLPAKNHLFVFDGRGKTVFEKTDYRNNWGAADLEDGYYVYVLKGDGIKTIKETLAIKRTAN